jgi:hypothetical protein
MHSIGGTVVDRSLRVDMAAMSLVNRLVLAITNVCGMAV